MESNDDLNVSFDGHATWQESLHCVKLFVSTLLENEREKTDEVQSKYIEVNSELQRLASELGDTCKDLHEARNAIDTLQRAVTEKAEIANRYLMEREDAYSKVVYLTGRLEMANRNQISGIGEADTFLREQRALASQLQGRVDQLEQKNAKLRDYIRKLTSKCEQWQQSWEQQLCVTLDPRN
jgi:polyhydroxyalkanoate synthesis regulator phasin